ncbi:hypothetical protein [Synechococcus sp. UW179A]|nr:hypothetical protein [Synechococcus sp. UW179A]
MSRTAIALGICALKQESRVYNACLKQVIADGRTNAEAVYFCNGA